MRSGLEPWDNELLGPVEMRKSAFIKDKSSGDDMIALACASIQQGNPISPTSWRRLETFSIRYYGTEHCGVVVNLFQGVLQDLNLPKDVVGLKGYLQDDRAAIRKLDERGDTSTLGFYSR